jgi:hypothetical protein
VDEGESWSIGARKRKKGKDQDLIKGIKLRKTSGTHQTEAAGAKKAITATGDEFTATNAVKTDQIVQRKAPLPTETVTKTPGTKATSPVLGLGLGAYSSDEDD